MKKKSGCFSVFKKFLLFLGSFIGLLVLAIAIYNLSLPTASPQPETLSPVDLSHMQEVDYLRQHLGDKIWKGWDSLNIPILLYNEEYAFLYSEDQPADGWKRFPLNMEEGGAWISAAESLYYFQKLKEDEPSPQAFIVETGDLYAASMTTYNWSKVKLIDTIQEELPGFLSPVFPYGLFLSRFSSEWHITTILHESFHSFQANSNREKLERSERSLRLENDYLWDHEDFRELWLSERKLLAEILREEGPPDSGSIRKWLNMRKERRRLLSNELIEYEQLREWSEGLAKYVENESLKRAGTDPNFTPSGSMDGVKSFKAYHKWENTWTQELNQLESNLQFSETIFYYSGWAQAVILDALDPEWKSEAMDTGFFLDSRISAALNKLGD